MCSIGLLNLLLSMHLLNIDWWLSDLGIIVFYAVFGRSIPLSLLSRDVQCEFLFCGVQF